MYPLKMTFRLLIFTIVLLWVNTVSAKWDPYIEDGDWSTDLEDAWAVPDAPVTTALYGLLDAEDDVDVFAYQFESPVQNWPLSLVVPVCGQHFADFYPSAALIGPELDVPEDIEALPLDLRKGTGALIFTDEKPLNERATVQWEPNGAYDFSEHRIDIPAAGDYFVVVWSPDEQRGAYTLLTGALHPDYKNRTEAELNPIFDNIFYSNAWMGVDCETKEVVSAGI